MRQDAQGAWIAEFDYFYTGLPRGAYLWLQLSEKVDGQAYPASELTIAQRGRHHVSIEVQRPWIGNGNEARTSHVTVQFREGNQTFVSESLAKAIDWPDFQTWSLDRQLAAKSTHELLKRAVTLIDSGDNNSLDEAKHILERLTTKDPKFDAAYVELARVAMKTNWGPEGLHQAELLLSSALQINPDSANAKILLGYVYSHQNRFNKAEALFTDVARVGSTNLWLWSNWGELLTMQGKPDQAAQKYREAVTRPRTNDTYDRARIDAYQKLIVLLEKTKDLNGIEALHKQRVAEFGNGSCDCARVCYSAEYARFLLQYRNETNEAIKLAHQALDSNCRKDEAREALGMAYYAAWAGETEAKRNELLNQARIYLPPGPRPLYLLATSDRTSAVVQQLIAAGESIDQRDNSNQSALAYAFERNDLPAARRLLKLGARTDATVGLANMPVAFVPVITGDVDGIALMRKFGVDYSKIRFGGITAIEHAKKIGDHKLLEALDPNANAL